MGVHPARIHDPFAQLHQAITVAHAIERGAKITLFPSGTVNSFGIAQHADLMTGDAVTLLAVGHDAQAQFSLTQCLGGARAGPQSEAQCDAVWDENEFHRLPIFKSSTPNIFKK